MSDVSANKTLVKFPRWKVKDGFRSECRNGRGLKFSGTFANEDRQERFPQIIRARVILLFLKLQFGFSNSNN